MCLGLLHTMAQEFAEEMRALQTEIDTFSRIWNPLVAEYAARFPEDSCPLHPIVVHHEESCGAFLFIRAINAVQAPDGALWELLCGNVLGRKTLFQCWRLCEKARI